MNLKQTAQRLERALDAHQIPHQGATQGVGLVYAQIGRNIVWVYCDGVARVETSRPGDEHTMQLMLIASDLERALKGE